MTDINPADIRILIAEDSLTQAVKLEYILKNESFTVTTARNGLEAWQLLQTSKPTIIISDIVMPEMDGYELCRRIKADESYRNIPVILLTSLSDLQDVINALESGADNFVTKPYTAEFLLSRIKHILINQKLRADSSMDTGIDIFFANQQFVLSSEPAQIVDLLLSTFENAVQKNTELQEANRNLIAMQRELQQTNKKLELLNNQKDYFLGMAAHDLRNPLAHITTITEILTDDLAGVMTRQQKELLGMAHESSMLMVDLIEELLDIAKIESGKLELKLQRTELIAFVERNINFNRTLAARKDIALEFLHDGSNPVVNIDPQKMKQVLNNLVGNAIKFSHPHTRITVSITGQSEHALISVRDEGQGIPPNELDKVFIPFKRTSVSSTAGERSTGLGLAIVKKIVDGHGGKIWVESEVGKGSTFFVSLAPAS